MSTSLPPSPISATIDLAAPGLRHGFLRLPYSRDDSAWGSVMIPLCVAVNGVGPTVLLTGGNHGDEYEGPGVLLELAATLDLARVTGRIIMLPGLNYPAFQAGTRTSPIDKGNLNRAFPGRPDGTVTQKIADYVQRVLLPMADVVLDFHSGGKTLDFVPFCAAHADAPAASRAFELVRAFGAPYSMRMLEIDAVGMFDTAAEAMGKVFVTTELGGGGTLTARSLQIARQGLHDLLIAAGVWRGELTPRPTEWLDMADARCFHFAEAAGLLAPAVDLGDDVRAGDVLARIWPITQTGAAPTTIVAQRDGMLCARHFPGLVQVGDCVAVLAERLSGC